MGTGRASTGLGTGGPATGLNSEGVPAGLGTGGARTLEECLLDWELKDWLLDRALEKQLLN